MIYFKKIKNYKKFLAYRFIYIKIYKIDLSFPYESKKPSMTKIWLVTLLQKVFNFMQEIFFFMIQILILLIDVNKETFYSCKIKITF